MVGVLSKHGWETAVFRGATAVALLHAVDDAFLNRQPGVDLGQHAVAAAVAPAAGVAAAVAFPRLRPGLRAGLALLFGVLAVANGALHLIHVTDGGVAASDPTGVLALAAGAVLLLLGLAIPFAHRGEGARTRGRRWAYRVLVVAAGAVLVYVLVFPTSVALVQTHKYREPIGAPPGAAYEAASFTASDGLELAGWYRPSRNGAAVNHTAAIRERPGEYERRVVGFFDRALLGRAGAEAP